jgi:hypothetical protein
MVHEDIAKDRKLAVNWGYFAEWTLEWGSETL